jgi:hypothetical protein
MRTSKLIVYELTKEDIQTVAIESFGRKLTAKEIKKIIDPIGERIPWFDIIEDCIREYLDLESEKEYI